MSPQEIFILNITKLIDSVYSNSGFSIKIDHNVDIAKGKDEHLKKLREAKLSVNLNLFKDGVYLTQTPNYAELGALWKTLNPNNIWGGDSGYGCVFSMAAE